MRRRIQRKGGRGKKRVVERKSERERERERETDRQREREREEKKEKEREGERESDIIPVSYTGPPMLPRDIIVTLISLFP